MTASTIRHTFAVALVMIGAASLLGACSGGATPAPAEPAAAPTPPREETHRLDTLKTCTSNDECPVDQTCRGHIRATGATTGGPMVYVCDAPQACADDTNCTPPQRCQNGGCR